MGACSESIGMVFNRSGNAGFFLTLEDNDSPSAGVVLNPGSPAASEPDPVAPAAENPAAEAVATVAATTAPAKTALTAKTASQTKVAATTGAQTKQVQTTAEAIAAELAAAEAARPPVPLTTFAPDNLMPGSALRQSRRRPGAAMKGFRVLAGDLFKA